MPRLTGNALRAYADLHRRAYAPTIADTLAAIEAANLPIDLVPVRTAAALTCQTRSFFSKRVRQGDIKAFRVGSRLLVSLSQAVALVQSKRDAHAQGLPSPFSPPLPR